MARISWLIAFTATLALACGKSEDKPADKPAGDKPASGKTPDGETPAGEPPTADTGAAKADPALMAELQKIVDGCEINVDGVTVTKCKNKEERTLVDSFRKKERDRGKAIDTWVVALTGDDDKIKTVAANTSGSVFEIFKDSEVDPAAAKRLVAAVGKLEKYHAAQSVRSAVHAAAKAKVFDELYAMLDAHSYEPVKSIGYEHVMTNGRLDPLPKLKELAKGDNEKVAAAALSAPRRMYKPTDAEKAAVCPWAKEYITSDNKKIYKEAGHTMVWCGGEFVDALLDEGEKRLAKNEFDRDSYMVFRDVCFSMVKGMDVPGRKEQCERNYKFLEKAVNNDKLEGQARGLALFAIYYQRRDAETMKVMKKYKNSKVPEINKYANESIKSLQDTYKIK